MRKQSFVSILLVCAAAGSLWACGSDSDDTGAEGGSSGSAGHSGNSSGSAGHSGNSSGSAGHSGNSSGGAAGNGGSSSGGIAGNGGSSSGGTAGIGGSSAGGSAGNGGSSTGGSAGTGGGSGSGGTTAGGTGSTAAGMGGMGVGGEMAGAAGEMGEAGASGVTPIADVCATICGDTSGFTCVSSTCVDDCLKAANTGQPDAEPASIVAMFRCEAAKLTTDGYVCNDQGGPAVAPSPKNNSACQTEVCAYNCDPDAVVYVDAVVYGDCGC